MGDGENAHLGEFLKAAVARNPEKVFVEMSGDKITFRRLLEMAFQTAGMFQAMGVAPGDRVCLFMPNCPEYLYCWFGLSLLGAIGVPINTAYKRDEMAFILNDAGATALVADHTLVATAQEAAALAPGVRHKLVVEDTPDSNSPNTVESKSGVKGNPSMPSFLKEGLWGISSGWNNFATSLNESDGLKSQPHVSPGDISMLVYTSGTTGNPKGVIVTHQMYVAAGQGFAHWTRATPTTGSLAACPIIMPTSSIIRPWEPWRQALPWWWWTGLVRPGFGARYGKPGPA